MINYFVSIGDCYSHEWQANFLIESFKNLGLDNLHICLCSDKKIKNLKISWPNIYFFPDKGKEKEYLKYNKWYSLWNLVKNNIIKPPIVVLEPHVLFCGDIESLINNSKGDVIYQQDVNFLYNEKYFKKEIFNFDQEHLAKYWLNFGDTIIFKNASTDIFLSILNNMKEFSLYLDDYDFLDKISILGCLLNKNLIVEPRVDIESNLYENNINYFINYKYGFKNIFQKSFYKNNINFCGKSIKQNLSEIRYTKALDIFYQISNYVFDA